jgi:hypothetical protein
MRGKTPGYVLKVVVASTAIGCGGPTPPPEDSHPVGIVAPAPTPPPADTSHDVGTVARPPDVADAAAPAPKPTGHKVGMLAPSPDLDGVTVGTTAKAPDAPKK